jgi:hypothetical protein
MAGQAVALRGHPISRHQQRRFFQNHPDMFCNALVIAASTIASLDGPSSAKGAGIPSASIPAAFILNLAHRSQLPVAIATRQIRTLLEMSKEGSGTGGLTERICVDGMRLAQQRHEAFNECRDFSVVGISAISIVKGLEYNAGICYVATLRPVGIQMLNIQRGMERLHEALHMGLRTSLLACPPDRIPPGSCLS